jgi:hypothetical protein
MIVTLLENVVIIVEVIINKRSDSWLFINEITEVVADDVK